VAMTKGSFFCYNSLDFWGFKIDACRKVGGKGEKFEAAACSV